MCIDAIVNGVYLISDKLAMPVQRDILVSEEKCVVDNTEVASKEACAQYLFDEYVCVETCPPGFYGKDGVCSDKCH